MVEFLPTKSKVLSSNTSTTKKRKKERKKMHACLLQDKKREMPWHLTSLY
jgi:hypothetical protein